MKKTLICLDNLDEFVCRETHRLYMDNTRLLTPGAKDELTRRGILIDYGTKNAVAPTGAALVPSLRESLTPSLRESLASCPDMEHLVFGLAAMLKNECGITDPDELRRCSIKALQTIKEHI